MFRLQEFPEKCLQVNDSYRSHTLKTGKNGRKVSNSGATNALALEQLKEALCDYVVMAVATSAHAAEQMVVAQELLPIVSSKLAPMNPILYMHNTSPGHQSGQVPGLVSGSEGGCACLACTSKLR